MDKDLLVFSFTESLTAEVMARLEDQIKSKLGSDYQVLIVDQCASVTLVPAARVPTDEIRP